MGAALLISGNNSIAAPAFDETVDAQHQRAVELARQDKHADAIKILKAILAKDPKNYPVRRDYVVIATWMGDCDLALKEYQPIKNYPDQESYLAVPVAECMDQAGDTEEALKLLTAVNRRSGDKESQDALRRIKRRFALEQRPVLDVAAETSKSDVGAREWFLSARLKNRINAQWSWYVRFLHVRADDPDFDTGDFHRLGAGVIYGINRQFTVIQDFAAELHGFEDFGSTTTLIYSPTLLLNGQLEYATFTEDVPLRGRAIGLEGKRLSATVDYHTHDYRWESSAGVSRYDFSDGNNRWSLYGNLGYAFELVQKREQRLIGGLSHSTNSRSDVVYFSPERDYTTTLTYKLDIVTESRFPRHVDHYYAWVGSYVQKEARTSAIYGVRYEQDYDFDELTSFTWGVALRSSVYDGNRETEGSLLVSVSRKL
jgi:tetratricopeptide (TPR) repeat protein